MATNVIGQYGNQAGLVSKFQAFIGLRIAETAQYLIGNKYINNDFSNGDVITLYAVWNRAYDILLNIPDGMSIADLCIKVPQGSGYDEYYV